MNISHFQKLIYGALLVGGLAWLLAGNPQQPPMPKVLSRAPEATKPLDSNSVIAASHNEFSHARASEVEALETEATIFDANFQLCQGYSDASCGCVGGCDNSCGSAQVSANGFAYPVSSERQPVKMMDAVNQQDRGLRREAGWRNGGQLPWEAFAYGEYIGPHRTPHVADYQLRVDDQLEFVYLINRTKSIEPYELFVGDVIQTNSAIDPSLNQTSIQILADGTISLPLIGRVAASGKSVQELEDDLNENYKKFVKNPSIVVQVVQGQTPIQDLRDAVDARFGQGGQSRGATVSPDGTIQLPLIGSVPAVGLTLREIGREVDARYAQKLRGMEVTPILVRRAPRFIYVVGEVRQAGRFELTGPTSALQAVALANGFTQGGNIRQIIVFRRDQNWQLTATKLDLAGALFGKAPNPSDEIWLRDSDIVLIPKRPIQRMSEAVNLYLSSTIYAIFPQQGVQFNFDNFTNL